jgi:glycosyltransferase involved in cell wall biosynthesis
VSVLVPAYNAETWLAATIRSALHQTWPRIEVIVVDDGSTDRTLSVARTFESDAVKVVAQRNMGAPAARNRALELAQGDYIQWLDADDLLDPDKIAAQMTVARDLSDPRVLLSCPFGTFYFRPEKAVFTPTPLWRDLTPLDYLLTRFADNACFQTGAWLVSRELTHAAGPWKDEFYRDDDGEYFCRVAMQSSVVKFVPNARTYYRAGNYGSLNNASSPAALRSLYLAKAECVKHLLSLEDSARSRAACLRLLQDWLPYFYPEQESLVADAQRLAKELGGELRRPPLKWKYRPVEWLFGYRFAMQTSRLLPRVRCRAEATWDGVMRRLSCIEDRDAGLIRN